MRLSRLLVVGCLLVVLPACGSDIKRTIIGKWKSTNSGTAGVTITATFTKDGKVTFDADGPGGQKSVSGKYKVRPDDTVEFYDMGGLTLPTPKVREEVSIDKDEMTMTDPGKSGKKATFKRQ